MAIHFSGQTVFSLSHIEGITLGANEEVDEVAGGAREKIHYKTELSANAVAFISCRSRLTIMLAGSAGRGGDRCCIFLPF